MPWQLTIGWTIRCACLSLIRRLNRVCIFYSLWGGQQPKHSGVQNEMDIIAANSQSIVNFIHIYCWLTACHIALRKCCYWCVAWTAAFRCKAVCTVCICAMHMCRCLCGNASYIYVYVCLSLSGNRTANQKKKREVNGTTTAGKSTHIQVERQARTSAYAFHTTTNVWHVCLFLPAPK